MKNDNVSLAQMSAYSLKGSTFVAKSGRETHREGRGGLGREGEWEREQEREGERERGGENSVRKREEERGSRLI